MIFFLKANAVILLWGSAPLMLQAPKKNRRLYAYIGFRLYKICNKHQLHIPIQDNTKTKRLTINNDQPPRNIISNYKFKLLLGWVLG